MERAKDYEFRTTEVKELLSEENLLQIGGLIKGAKRYYLLRFKPRKTLDPSYRQKTSYTEEELKNLALRLKEYAKRQIRWFRRQGWIEIPMERLGKAPLPAFYRLSPLSFCSRPPSSS